jgi:putative ATP-dependent endonuclease of OLD family
MWRNFKVIKKLILKNFKKFKYLELDLNESMNILVGDNEAGKSSLLLALDLVLSASRSKVEKYGLEGLMNIDTVKFFFDGERTIEDLPELSVEVFLSEQSNFETNGANNTKGIICDGLRFECRPIDNYHEQILDLIKKSDTNFPYEYYSVEFTTFSGDPYSPYKKHLKHIFIDSSLVNSDYATKEYVKSVYSVTAKTEEKYKLKNEYRQSKRDFVDNSLELINKPLSDYKFSLRFGEKHSIEENLIITDNDIPINYKGKGRQSFIKTEFALQKHSENDLDIVLLEEPENHLSHMNMKSLIEKIRQSTGKQLFIATHSSLVTSRLGLNSVQMIGQNGVVRSLSELPGNTPDFFTKAPNSNLLEFILSERVILVEGSAEFILMNAFYKKNKRK